MPVSKTFKKRYFTADTNLLTKLSVLQGIVSLGVGGGGGKDPDAEEEEGEEEGEEEEEDVVMEEEGGVIFSYFGLILSNFSVL